MKTIIQTTVKELVLRFHPDALSDMLKDDTGRHFPFEFRNDEAVAYAIVLKETDNSEPTVEIYNLVGVQNGKVVGIGCGISNDEQEPSRWVDLNDEEIAVYIHPMIGSDSDVVPYMAFYEPVEPYFSTALPLGAPEGKEPLETIVPFYETIVGAECAHGGLEGGNYGVVSLRDMLTGRKFSYVVILDDDANNAAFFHLGRNPSALLRKLPECMELLGLATVTKLITYASETIGFVNGEPQEPVVSTGHAFSIADQLTEEPVGTINDSDDYVESEEEAEAEDEFAAFLSEQKGKSHV